MICFNNKDAEKWIHKQNLIKSTLLFNFILSCIKIHMGNIFLKYLNYDRFDIFDAIYSAKHKEDNK